MYVADDILLRRHYSWCKENFLETIKIKHSTKHLKIPCKLRRKEVDFVSCKIHPLRIYELDAEGNFIPDDTTCKCKILTKIWVSCVKFIFLKLVLDPSYCSIYQNLFERNPLNQLLQLSSNSEMNDWNNLRV
jgi:hypothetical protein